VIEGPEAGADQESVTVVSVAVAELITGAEGKAV
jgi:hypothetical protein